MDNGRVRKLKLALALATAAYVTYFQLAEEEKEKKNNKPAKRRRTEFTTEESSSSDENEAYRPRRRPKNRSQTQKIEKQIEEQFDDNKHVKSSELIDSYISKFPEDQFKDAFRVSRNTTIGLIDRFKVSPEYKNIFKLNDQTGIPAKQYILMFLWFVGRKRSYLQLSKMFNVPLSKSVCVVDTVLQFLNHCSRDFIKLPETPSELRDSAASFEQIAGFPEVIACLISTETQAKTNEKSFAAQAFCDSNGRFLDVFIDSTFNVHPIKVLEKSQINGKLKNICQGKYHVLAKSDFFVREWILTPIEEPSQEEHYRYNQKHTKTMRVVSDSLETLTKRFQQLTNVQLFSSNKIKRLFIACCVLQNICLEQEDFFDLEEVPSTAGYFVDNSEESHNRQRKKPIDDNLHLRKIGELKRKQLTTELKD